MRRRGDFLPRRSKAMTFNQRENSHVQSRVRCSVCATRWVERRTRRRREGRGVPRIRPKPFWRRCSCCRYRAQLPYGPTVASRKTSPSYGRSRPETPRPFRCWPPAAPCDRNPCRRRAWTTSVVAKRRLVKSMTCARCNASYRTIRTSSTCSAHSYFNRVRHACPTSSWPTRATSATSIRAATGMQPTPNRIISSPPTVPDAFKAADRAWNATPSSS